MVSMSSARAPVCGLAAFALGALALVSALVVFWAGPFAPVQEPGAGLGQLAADIAQAAARRVAGAPAAEPVRQAMDIDDWLRTAVAAAGGLAIVLAGAGLIRGEPKRAGLVGLALAAVAITFQLFVTLAFALIGALVVAALIYALGDTLSNIFSGLTGG